MLTDAASLMQAAESNGTYIRRSHLQARAYKPCKLEKELQCNVQRQPEVRFEECKCNVQLHWVQS